MCLLVFRDEIFQFEIVIFGQVTFVQEVGTLQKPVWAGGREGITCVVNTIATSSF